MGVAPSRAGFGQFAAEGHPLDADGHICAAVRTQVYLPKDNATMTGVNTGTAAPVSLNYISGLRGAPDAKMALVNLTVDPPVTIGKYR